MLAQVDHLPDSLAPWIDDPRWWRRSPSYQDPRLIVSGIPLPEIVEHLRLVYTESVCQQMVIDGMWAPLLGLFTAASWIEWFGIMLALGVDLHQLGPERLAPYGARLRTGEQWWGARLEVGVEAGLRRIGHDPRRPDLPSDAKQWDFSDEQDGVPLLFECKALSPGDGDGNFDLVEQRFQNLGAVFQHEHRVDALLCFSPSMLREIRERRPQIFYECVLPEFTEELTRLLANATIDGNPRRVGRFGNLTLVPCERNDGFLGQWQTCGYESLPIHRLRRLMNTFGDATDNFTGAPTGVQRVAVVWTGKEYLSPSGVAPFIEGNVGRAFRVRKTSLKLDRRRLGFDRAVLMGSHRPFDSPGWLTDSATFDVDRGFPTLPTVLVGALSSWSYHATLTSS